MYARICRILRFAQPDPQVPGLLFSHGGTVPSADSGYAPGCLFIDTTTGAVYRNSGTYASCTFTAVAYPDDLDNPVMVGEFATGASTSTAIQMTDDLDVWEDGQLDVMSVFAGTDSNVGSAYSAKAGRFRHVVNADDDTVETETYGLVGQLVARSVTLGHLHAGIMGTFEGHTEGVVLDSNYTFAHAAVIARVGGAAAITATSPICGFVAWWNNAAALASGTSVAYAADCVGTTYKWTYGMDLPRDSVVKGIRVGAYVASAATTGGVVFAEAMDVYGDNQLDVVEAHGASSANLGVGYCTKVGRFRHIVNCTDADHETYGLMGQVVAKSTTLSHCHAGLIGTFEGHTSGVVLDSSYNIGAAGVIARVGGLAAITATTPVAGFQSFLNANTGALGGGTAVAFAADVLTSTYPWDIGLWLPSGASKVGIQLGDGLSSSAQIGHHIGTSGRERAIALWVDDNNVAMTTDAQGLNCRLAIFYSQAGAYAASCLRGQLRIVNASIQNSEGKAWQGVSGVVETSGTPTLGDGTHWNVFAALNGAISAAGTTVAANAVLTGLHITGKCPSSQSGEMIGILFEASAQGYEHAFGFTGIGATDGNGLVEQAGGTITCTHKIAIWINGVGTRYIPVGTIA